MKWLVLTLLIASATQPVLAASLKKPAVQSTQIKTQNQSADYINTLMQLAKNGDSAKLDELTKLAEQGNPYAQGNLARMYTNGWGTPKDYAAAMSWAHKAADQGNRDGMNVVGVLFLNGLGVTKDAAEGLKWIRQAAELGSAKAQLNLGIAYRTGNGVAQDDAQALQWCTKAADQGGDADAQTTLGDLYHDGKGVAQDDIQAAQWYRKAAAQGNANAQNRLGYIYLNGRGVVKDEIQAAQWYRKAAAQGNEAARQNIAYMESQHRDKAPYMSPTPNASPEQINAPSPVAGNAGRYKSPYTGGGSIAAWAQKRDAGSDNGSDIAGAIGGSVGQQVANKALDFVPFGLGSMLGKNAGESVARSATSQTIAATLPTAEEIAASSDLSFSTAEDLSLFMYAKYSRDADYPRVLALTMQVYPEMQIAYASAIEKAAQEKIKTADATPNPAAAKPTIAQRLESLKKLKEDGLISEKEYQTKRKKLIDEL